MAVVCIIMQMSYYKLEDLQKRELPHPIPMLESKLNLFNIVLDNTCYSVDSKYLFLIYFRFINNDE